MNESSDKSTQKNVNFLKDILKKSFQNAKNFPGASPLDPANASCVAFGDSDVYRQFWIQSVPSEKISLGAYVNHWERLIKSCVCPFVRPCVRSSALVWGHILDDQITNSKGISLKIGSQLDSPRGRESDPLRSACRKTRPVERPPPIGAGRALSVWLYLLK